MGFNSGFKGLTSPLRRGGWSPPRPGPFTTPGKTRYQLYRRLGGPQDRSGQVRKISRRPLGRPCRISYAETESPVQISSRPPFSPALRYTEPKCQTNCFSTVRVCVTTIMPLSCFGNMYCFVNMYKFW